MRLFLEDEGALDLKLPYEELATKVADAVLDYEKCPYEAQVELLLTMNEEIRQMNLEFRGIDRATDVLSFPMTEFPSPADYSAFLKRFFLCLFHSPITSLTVDTVTNAL